MLYEVITGSVSIFAVKNGDSCAVTYCNRGDEPWLDADWFIGFFDSFSYDGEERILDMISPELVWERTITK